MTEEFVEDVIARKVGLIGYSADDYLEQTSVFANNKFVQACVLIGIGVSLGWCAHQYLEFQMSILNKKKNVKKVVSNDSEEERSPPAVKKQKHRI